MSTKPGRKLDTKPGAGRPGTVSPGPVHKDAPRSAEKLHLHWIYIALFLATFAVYFQVHEFDFFDYDDPDYSGNVHALGGITKDGLVWALTSGAASNWFPVTRVSHLLDNQLFGTQSGLHHLTNVLIHSLAALLLFAFLHRATGARWRSALVAFLFALHPLHVESVAWISERKDVLSAFFAFLALWTYVRYAERPDLRRYLLVLLPFSLGLMAKPMLVSLPFLLLLIDIWPLRRLAVIGASEVNNSIPWQRVLWEKVPFFVLAAGTAVIAYLTQKSAGSVSMLSVPIVTRVENALVSYMVYIAKMIWPTGLAVIYPYPRSIPAWQAVLAGMTIAATSAFALYSFRARPYLAFGWLWYLGTLVPVIGLVQVGVQSRADRYMYIPMVGLAIAVAWAAGDVVERWPRAKPGVIACLTAACLCATAATWVQLRYWKNSESVYRRAIEVTDANYTMHYGLGVLLAKTPSREPEAIAQYEAALRAKPEYLEARSNLATLLMKVPGRLPDAITNYEAALRINPESAAVHNNLGVALARVPARLSESIPHYEAALRIKPDFTEARNNLSQAHFNLGLAIADDLKRLEDAISEYRAALQINPDFAEAHNNLANALSRMPDRLPEAIAEYEAALRIKPEFMEAHYNLAVVLAKTPNRVPEALSHFEEALRIKPDPALRQMVDRLRAGSH